MKNPLLYIFTVVVSLVAVSCGKASTDSERTVVFRLEMPGNGNIQWVTDYERCFHIFQNGVEANEIAADFSGEDVILTLTYPASSASSFEYTGFVNGRSSKNPAVGTEQNCSGEKYDVSSDIMIVDPLVMYPMERESFLDLERIVSICRVYVDGLGAEERITSVNITSTSDIASLYSVPDGKFKPGGKILTVSGESHATSEGEVFSFVSVPTSSKLTFEITTSDKSISIDSGVELKAGLNDIFLSVSGGGPVGPVGPSGAQAGWLELPSMPSSSNAFVGSFFSSDLKATSGKGKDRNYTYYYDKENYTCLWVAYPLYDRTTGSGGSGAWDYNPAIDSKYQVNLYSSYNVLYGETEAVDNADATGEEYYARGHQIPNADRSGNDVMQAQTYFFTNSTPQIQNAFNASVWSKLEAEVRSQIPYGDTLYVVTGAAFRTVGGNEKITYIHPKRDPYKEVPVPNYYWKVLLKVKRSGSSVSSASAIGYWLPHRKLSGASFSGYSCSVDDIEQKTGFDFFVNLPSEISSKAESNTSSSTFNRF